LGRNLITVFSTVNTPARKKRGDASRTIGARRAVRRMRRSHRRRRERRDDCDARNETSLFQRFSSRTARASRIRPGARDGTGRRVRECATRGERQLRALSPGRRFSASHKAECAKVRELRTRSDAHSGARDGRIAVCRDRIRGCRERVADARSRAADARIAASPTRPAVAKKTARVSAGGVVRRHVRLRLRCASGRYRDPRDDRNRTQWSSSSSSSA
jgi:hypothetical protein